MQVQLLVVTAHRFVASDLSVNGVRFVVVVVQRFLLNPRAYSVVVMVVVFVFVFVAVAVVVAVIVV